jgi:hypothetical protein
MGPGITTVRDGATIVPGDGSYQKGPEARACGLLGESWADRRSIVATKAAVPLHQPKKNGHTSGARQPTRLPDGHLIRHMLPQRQRVCVRSKSGGIGDRWMHASPCLASAMSLCSDREGILLLRPLLEISSRHCVHGCRHNGKLATRRRWVKPSFEPIADGRQARRTAPRILSATRNRQSSWSSRSKIRRRPDRRGGRIAKQSPPHEGSLCVPRIEASHESHRSRSDRG